MKKSILFIFALVAMSSLHAQSNVPLFIGIQPNITVEPFYEEGELDIDILPLVLEASIGSRTDIRLTPIVNYHFGGEEQGVSDLAMFVIMPFFLKEKQEASDLPYGFYLGPVVGFGRNLINDHFTTTLALEPGYLFETSKSFTIALGLQLGGSYFSYDELPNKWVTHWGPKFSFGFWINKG